MTAGVFAAVLGTLFVAHKIGDLWVQTELQVAAKGKPGWVGRLACARHVTGYTLTAAAILILVGAVLDLHLNPVRVAAGLATSAVTHYIADRRTPLRRLARWAGHEEFYTFGGLGG